MLAGVDCFTFGQPLVLSSYETPTLLYRNGSARLRIIQFKAKGAQRTAPL
jgi:hypothetical protein